MFVLNPDPYSLPCYRIGPFKTKDLSINHHLPQSNKIDDYFNQRFSGRAYAYTENGRRAIYLALQSLNLKKNDVVTILTTSNNFYISGCVTAEIEKFCQWSREMLPQTKAIFINHEFGFPYPYPDKLRDLGLPIIEDCANAFFSEGIGVPPGTVGDFVIYSFPKTFPLQVGGLLVADKLSDKNKNSEIDQQLLRHIKNVLSAYIDSKEDIIKKRLRNYNYLEKEFLKLGFEPRFQVDKGTMPGVFMFKTEGHQIDLAGLKNHFYAHGVQCSVFYGEEAFFIPVHQALVQDDLDYFVAVMDNFLNK
ncbi:dTDP-4-amino-4,6-dideoxygalactose transaminase [Saccharicrinis carchari]|uniref:dTDP-4-amino-4,6-dideoxygalactose transaminase n=1 Tax=Saccharicrinis carchari TaxID=1168039 RepID=A0A521BS23_SACCC|nr:DegT/DnrJ/EryC1/StrS family aminotransferase [Saccharicrinis carchari]SMO49923.1 dTDP-4-amino-4,6-dideoxygalactose transaminase [Saccharicrinis carchari]